MSFSRAQGGAVPRSCGGAFDDAVAELNRAATGSDLLAVASAYDQLADVAAQLAEALEQDDRSSGLLAQRRARRSA